jgi:antitoxin (DNA-binding transcriptional repressor) of toxin-antitoxin stability system
LLARVEPGNGSTGSIIRIVEPPVLHINEADLAKDVRSILERVRSGTEVVIERDAEPIAVLRAADPSRRKISDCIALLPADSTATIDADFAKDVEAAIAAHREPLEPPAWD